MKNLLTFFAITLFTFNVSNADNIITTEEAVQKTLTLLIGPSELSVIEYARISDRLKSSRLKVVTQLIGKAGLHGSLLFLHGDERTMLAGSELTFRLSKMVEKGVIFTSHLLNQHFRRQKIPAFAEFTKGRLLKLREMLDDTDAILFMDIAVKYGHQMAAKLLMPGRVVTVDVELASKIGLSTAP